jgi:cytochrome c
VDLTISPGRSWPVAIAIGVLLAGISRSDASDVAFGEYLAGECVTCHQRSGKANGIPAITGWPKESFVAVLNSYKVKERDNIVMQAIAARLKDDEVAALAAYFESLGEVSK